MLFHIIPAYGQQREVVVLVEDGEELQAVFRAHDVQANHQGGGSGGVLQRYHGMPFAVGILLVLQIRLQGDFGQLLQVLVVVLFLAAVVEVFRYYLIAFLQRQLDEVNLRQVVGELQLDALLGRILLAVHLGFAFPSHGGIHVQRR